MTDEELKALVAENSRAIAEMRISNRESYKRMDEQLEKLRISQEKTDEQMRKTDEQMRKTDERLEKIGIKIDKLGKLFGDFGNTRGEEVEDFFYRYFKKNKQLQGIKFDDVDRNIVTAEGQEHDIVMINGKSSALISVKYKAKKEDIDSLVKTEMERMKYYMVKLGSKHRLYGGIASYIMSSKVAEYAKSKGLFVITRSGENTIFLNDENFVAKVF